MANPAAGIGPSLQDRVANIEHAVFTGAPAGAVAGPYPVKPSPVSGNFIPPITTLGGGITGAINGSNTAFVLSSAPPSPSSLNLVYNGVWLLQGVDYTISGVNVTLAAAPTGGYLAAF